MKTSLFCLIRSPELNKVKTRIAKESDAQTALLVYEKLLDHTLEILAELPSGWDVSLAVDGNIPVSWQQRFERFACVRQSSGDIGDRMEACFQTAFKQGSDIAIVIGSDIPELTSQHLENLAQYCHEKDCALIPSKDGGYGAIALKGSHPELFRDLDWSTDKVMTQTRTVLSYLGLNWIEFDKLRDVDTLADAEYFKLTD